MACSIRNPGRKLPVSTVAAAQELSRLRLPAVYIKQITLMPPVKVEAPALAPLKRSLVSSMAAPVLQTPPALKTAGSGTIYSVAAEQVTTQADEGAAWTKATPDPTPGPEPKAVPGAVTGAGAMGAAGAGEVTKPAAANKPLLVAGAVLTAIALWGPGGGAKVVNGLSGLGLGLGRGRRSGSFTGLSTGRKVAMGVGVVLAGVSVWYFTRPAKVGK